MDDNEYLDLNALSIVSDMIHIFVDGGYQCVDRITWLDNLVVFGYLERRSLPICHEIYTATQKLIDHVYKNN